MTNLQHQVQELLANHPDECLLDLTTNLGLERVVEQELLEQSTQHSLPPPTIIKKPFGFNSHVLVIVPSLDKYWPAICAMHSIQHVMEFLDSFSIDTDEPLNRIYETMVNLSIPAMEDAKSFRLTCNRHGQHSFGSMDVQRVAGAAVQQHYQTEVDLTAYDSNIRLDIYDQSCIVGLQKTRESLINRYERPYLPRVSLKPHVAYGLVHLAELPTDTKGPLLDPFCGSATVLLEAAYRYPQAALYGSDKFEKAVEGAIINRDAHHLQHRIKLAQVNARALSSHYPPDFFQAIITNPPYGLKMGKKVNFGYFYYKFLQEAWTVLQPSGKMVVLIWKERAFISQLKRLNCFHKNAQFSVEVGGVYPKVYILQKKEPPES